MQYTGRSRWQPPTARFPRTTCCFFPRVPPPPNTAAALPTFFLPPGSFWDRIGKFLKFNVDSCPPRQGGQALGLGEVVVHFFQMPIQQILLAQLRAAGDHLVHRDAHRLELRHHCGVTAGVLQKRGYKSHQGAEHRGPRAWWPVPRSLNTYSNTS